jgi:hypothetical protein
MVVPRKTRRVLKNPYTGTTRDLPTGAVIHQFSGQAFAQLLLIILSQDTSKGEVCWLQRKKSSARQNTRKLFNSQIKFIVKPIIIAVFVSKDERVLIESCCNKYFTRVSKIFQTDTTVSSVQPWKTYDSWTPVRVYIKLVIKLQKAKVKWKRHVVSQWNFLCFTMITVGSSFKLSDAVWKRKTFRCVNNYIFIEYCHQSWNLTARPETWQETSCYTSNFIRIHETLQSPP